MAIVGIPGIVVVVCQDIVAAGFQDIPESALAVIRVLVDLNMCTGKIMLVTTLE